MNRQERMKSAYFNIENIKRDLLKCFPNIYITKTNNKISKNEYISIISIINIISFDNNNLRNKRSLNRKGVIANKILKNSYYNLILFPKNIFGEFWSNYNMILLIEIKYNFCFLIFFFIINNIFIIIIIYL